MEVDGEGGDTSISAAAPMGNVWLGGNTSLATGFPSNNIGAPFATLPSLGGTLPSLGPSSSSSQGYGAGFLGLGFDGLFAPQSNMLTTLPSSMASSANASSSGYGYGSLLHTLDAGLGLNGQSNDGFQSMLQPPLMMTLDQVLAAQLFASSVVSASDGMALDDAGGAVTTEAAEGYRASSFSSSSTLAAAAAAPRQEKRKRGRPRKSEQPPPPATSSTSSAAATASEDLGFDDDGATGAGAGGDADASQLDDLEDPVKEAVRKLKERKNRRHKNRTTNRRHGGRLPYDLEQLMGEQDVEAARIQCVARSTAVPDRVSIDTLVIFLTLLFLILKATLT